MDEHYLGAEAVIVGMGARVQDAVHVQVQVVELRQEGRVRNDLVDLRVPLRNPPVKLRNSHAAVLVLK